MKDRKLAVRYAKALLSVFPDPTQAEKTERFLTALGHAMQQSPEFRDLMLDPAFTREARTKAVRSMAGQAGLPAQVGNFMQLLVDNNRAASIPSIAEVFAEEREKALGIVPAELTTATPISDELSERARKAVERMTGNRVRLTCRVEPALLGGAVTRIGSRVYDGSLRTQLNRLQNRMARD